MGGTEPRGQGGASLMDCLPENGSLRDPAMERTNTQGMYQAYHFVGFFYRILGRV